MTSSLESMRIVARRLSPLNVPFAFVGGAALCVLVDNPDLMDLRPTLDVDVVVPVVTYVQYSELEAVLRQGGFQHDLSRDAPIFGRGGAVRSGAVKRTPAGSRHAARLDSGLDLGAPGFLLRRHQYPPTPIVRTTSSIVVSPAAALRIPSAAMVVMP